MHRHWAAFGPPAYAALAAYLGLNRRQIAKADQLHSIQDLADYLTAMPGGARV